MALSVFAAALGVVMFPAARAQAVTCQGQAATIVGPTKGQNTTGTEGDDVIVARLGRQSWVSGLGVNDTICLVEGPGDGSVLVRAGAGDDSVVNQTVTPRFATVELGPGADSFVGANYLESIFAADSDELSTGPDAEIDIIRGPSVRRPWQRHHERPIWNGPVCGGDPNRLRALAKLGPISADRRTQRRRPQVHTPCR